METKSREYFSIAAAAREIGVSTRTVYNWINAGKVNYFVAPSGRRRLRKRPQSDRGPP